MYHQPVNQYVNSQDVLRGDVIVFPDRERYYVMSRIPKRSYVEVVYALLPLSQLHLIGKTPLLAMYYSPGTDGLVYVESHRY